MTPPDRKATPRFLQRLSYDVLQRSLSPREGRVYRDAEVAAVVERMLSLREAMAAWFEEELYYFLLLDGFRQKNDAMERVPSRLSKGEITAKDAIGEILLSTGFSQRNPGNDTFVTVVLEQCLGYTVQDPRRKPVLEAGKKMYDGKKVRWLGSEGQNQSDLLKIVLGHQDFAAHLLDRHHLRLLRAPLGKDAPEVARVQQDFAQFFVVISEWLQSDSYWDGAQQKQPKSDRQFVRGLYMDLLERTPEYEELRSMRNAMQSMADPAPLRAVMAKVLLDSKAVKLPDSAPDGEGEFVRACFLRYLAREPEQTELLVFQKALRDDGATPAHIARALVGSLEYQLY